MLSLLVLAQSRGEQDPGGDGLGIGIIIAVLVLIAIGALVLFRVMAARSRASKGGVEAPAQETGHAHPGSPPLESVERRS
jgi:hypothetical protein